MSPACLRTTQRATSQDEQTSVNCRDRFPRGFRSMLTAWTLTVAWISFSQSLLSLPLHAEQSRQPNIILIMADDLGYRGIGCFGQEKIKTPSIDRIAAEGVKMTQCYSGSHVCQPSRSVLMTGLHTGHTPVRANDTRQFLLPEHVTVAELLHDAGYRTGGFGKWGLGYEGTPGHPNRQGFDQFVGQYLQVHAHFYYPFWIWENDRKVELDNSTGMNEYVNDVIHENAMTFMNEESDEPFFAYLPYIIPHVEVIVPEDSSKPYEGQFPKVSIQDSRKNYLGSEDGLTAFAGMVSRLDTYVGEILKLLDEKGIAENTLIIFTSDNGAQSGGRDAGWTKMTDYFKMNGELRGYKGSFYEGGMRVPMVARWPGRIPAGRTSDHITGFWDMLPTLCEAAGIASPKGIDGHSIIPAMTGHGQQTEHPAIYWEYGTGNSMGRATRMGKWKVIQQRPNRPIELYNLDVDVSESTNIADAHPDIVKKAVSVMDQAHVDQPPFPGPDVKTGVNDYVNGPWINE